MIITILGDNCEFFVFDRNDDVLFSGTSEILVRDVAVLKQMDDLRDAFGKLNVDCMLKSWDKYSILTFKIPAYNGLTLEKCGIVVVTFKRVWFSNHFDGYWNYCADGDEFVTIDVVNECEDM